MEVCDILDNMSQEDRIYSIVNCFDQIMALSDLIGKYEIKNVNSNLSNISFTVECETDSNANEIFNIISRQEVSKYGHIFVPRTSLNKTSIYIELYDKLQKVSG